jgi:hypothetical protein
MKPQLTSTLIQPYVDQGLVDAKRHSTLPLTIYNYSRECQFEQKWDDVTLQCRGLILDDSDKIIARGFDKFFNYEEVNGSGKIPLHDEYVYVQEKMDGSLGILFNYADEWHMATRGSFESDQAKEGLRILKTKYDLGKFHKKVAYICEIIYPENRIVVSYDEEKIMFLSAILEGRELNWATANAMFHSSGILDEDIVSTVMETISHNIFKRYKDLNELGKEGFVLRFHPSNYRIKIKFEEYVRLHRLLTNFSNIDIWDCLRNETDMSSYLEEVPDEFDSWVRQWIKAIQFAYVMKEKSAREWLGKVQIASHPSRKSEAEWILANVPKEYQGPVFSMLDGKNYSEHIWRAIRPEYQKPFWNQDSN